MARILWLPAIFACASQAIAQSSPKAESIPRLVNINVAATNAKDEPVTDLRAADVQVREDGKPRPVVFFRFAGTKRAVAPAAPGEFINRPALPPMVILFDRWNERILTASSGWLDIRSALRLMPSVDRVYIYFFTNRGDLFPIHPFPSAGTEQRVAEPLSADGLVAKLDAAVRNLNGFRDSRFQDPVLRENQTFQVLTTLATQMSSIAGRKSLIWITHGIPLTLWDPSGESVDFTPQVRNLSQAAARSQIPIYAVAQSAAGAGADPASEARQTLEMFAALTGGRLYASGSAERAVADTIADAGGNYRLAYYSSTRENDRKEHKIRVQSTRKDVRLLTRAGYFNDGTEPGPNQIEEDSFSSENCSPFDATEIGLRVAMSRKPAARIVHFDIRVDPADVFLERRGERYQGHLSVMLTPNSESCFQSISPPLAVDLSLTKEQFETASKDGLLISRDLPVSDQLQQVRVIVFDRALYALGSVTIPLLSP